MVAALRSVLELPIGDGDRCDVLLITDGQIHASNELLDLARQAGQRIFVVGIGMAVPEQMLRELAFTTGGACEFVVAGEAARDAILRTFGRLRSQHCSELRLRWPAPAQEPFWLSALPPAAFHGDTLHLWAWLPQPPAGEIVLEGRLDGQDRLVELGRIPVDAASAAGELLPRMVVSRELAQWAQTQEPRSMRAMPAELRERALSARLITAQTSFLLVHERDEVPAVLVMPRQHIVPSMPVAACAAPVLKSVKVAAFARSAPAFFEACGTLHIPKQASVPAAEHPFRPKMPAATVQHERASSVDESSSSNSPQLQALMEQLVSRNCATPLEVQARLLLETDPARRPRSWEELRQAGVPNGTVVRLRQGCQELDEARAVADLIELLMDWDWGLQAPASPDSGGVCREWFLQVLVGMSVRAWIGAR
jgi:Ca-activated chloride channel family protein